MTGVARGWTVNDAVVARPAVWRRMIAAIRVALAAAPRPQWKRPYYPPLREGFVEDAAMAREMWRL